MLMNMKEILAPANEHNFAVPAFNVSSNMILKGVMHTCEEMQAPVIISPRLLVQRIPAKEHLVEALYEQ